MPPLTWCVHAVRTSHRGTPTSHWLPWGTQLRMSLHENTHMKQRAHFSLAAMSVTDASDNSPSHRFLHLGSTWRRFFTSMGFSVAGRWSMGTSPGRYRGRGINPETLNPTCTGLRWDRFIVVELEFAKSVCLHCWRLEVKQIEFFHVAKVIFGMLQKTILFYTPSKVLHDFFVYAMKQFPECCRPASVMLGSRALTNDEFFCNKQRHTLPTLCTIWDLLHTYIY
jgi:hypothetical protein